MLIKIKKSAFTLAEVLITLGVIGIVSALTIPGLIDKFERQRNATVLKRAYSDLHSYVKMYALEKGCNTEKLSNCTSVDNKFATGFAVWLHDKQGFKDGIKEIYGDYMYFSYPNNRTKYNDINDIRDISKPLGRHYLISNKGYAYIISYFFNRYENTAGYKILSLNDSFIARIWILTDSKRRGKNIIYYKGAERPEVGRNLFELYITESQRVVPNGSPLCDSAKCSGSWCYYCGALPKSNSCEDNYNTCLQQVINDGWQIKYKY